ncbi:MAG TPA: SDR family oxidoreductase [Candidatus Binatia bacterium]|nr:SDR family oxidoreductase [Candidatus Binatia bacterium]
MDLGLKNKIVVVGGASKGIGKATALGFAREGAKVTICARDPDVLQGTAEEIRRETGAEVLAVPGDLSQGGATERLIDETVARFGTVHVLVANTGGPPLGGFDNMSDAEWEKAFALNFLSTVRLIRKALPHMQKQQWGRILSVMSMSVKEPLDGLILSNGVRPAVVGMAKTLSREVGKYNITVNTVLPGRILTDRLKGAVTARAQRVNRSFDEALQESAADVPLRRIGDPQEMANVIVFLASEAASYVNGVSIQVDGGLIRGLL